MNAIAKAAFEHSRELAKLPTVEQIREIVLPGENVQNVQTLLARVDNTLAIYADRIPKDYPDAALFLARAKEHLCDPRNKTNNFFQMTGIPPMDAGDVDAWFVLNDVQQHLWEAKSVCQIPVECGQDAYPCGKPSPLFCADCGEDICDEHSERVGQVTCCEGCASFVKLGN